MLQTASTQIIEFLQVQGTWRKIFKQIRQQRHARS